MTRAEKEYIFENADKFSIAPSEPLNLYEMKAYIKGFEDAIRIADLFGISLDKLIKQI